MITIIPRPSPPSRSGQMVHLPPPVCGAPSQCLTYNRLSDQAGQISALFPPPSPPSTLGGRPPLLLAQEPSGTGAGARLSPIQVPQGGQSCAADRSKAGLRHCLLSYGGCVLSVAVAILNEALLGFLWSVCIVEEVWNPYFFPLEARRRA